LNGRRRDRDEDAGADVGEGWRWKSGRPRPAAIPRGGDDRHPSNPPAGTRPSCGRRRARSRRLLATMSAQKATSAARRFTNDSIASERRPTEPVSFHAHELQRDRDERRRHGKERVGRRARSARRARADGGRTRRETEAASRPPSRFGRGVGRCRCLIPPPPEALTWKRRIGRRTASDASSSELLVTVLVANRRSRPRRPCAPKVRCRTPSHSARPSARLRDLSAHDCGARPGRQPRRSHAPGGTPSKPSRRGCGSKAGTFTPTTPRPAGQRRFLRDAHAAVDLGGKRSARVAEATAARELASFEAERTRHEVILET